MSSPELPPAGDPPGQTARPLHVLLVVLLTLLALGLRLWGLDHLLPHRLEPDRQIAQQVMVLEEGLETPSDEKVMSKYPWVLARLATLGFTPPAIQTDATPRDLAAHRRRSSSVSLRVRLWVAVLGSVSIPLTWWLARRLLSSSAALLAAALMATSLLHHDFSQQARAHVPAATFVLLTLGCAARAAAGGGRLAWLGASVAAALAFGSLQSGVAAVLPLAMVIWRRRQRDGLRSLGRALVPALSLLAALLFFYPFLLEGSSEGTAGEQASRFELRGTRLRHGTHVVDLALFDGRGFRVVARSLWMYDPWLFIGLGVGAVTWLFTRRGPGPRCRDSRAVVLAYALPYLLVIGLYLRSYQRFVIPLLPAFAILAAFGWSRLGEGLQRRAPRAARLVVPALWLAILVPAVATGCRLSWLRSRPDTYERFADWIEEELDPERERLLVLPPAYLPPLFQSEELARQDSFGEGRVHRVYWTDYQRLVPPASKPEPLWPVGWVQFRPKEDATSRREDPLAWLQGKGADYVALESIRPRSSQAEGRSLRSHLQASAKLALELAPDASGLPLDYNEERQSGPWHPHHALRLWRAEAMGTPISVYRISEPEDRSQD